MWPSSPARAWARRASMVSSIPDSFRVRSALSRAPVSIVVVMAWPSPVSVAGAGEQGGGRVRGEGGHDASSVPGTAARSGTTFPRRRGRGGEQGVRAVQERRRAAVPGRRGDGRGLGAGGEDALDGPVGRVAGGGRLRAGGLEPAGLVLVGQVQHALRGAQPVQGVVFQQPADQRLAGRADLGGLPAAPRRGAHVERDLLRRVIGQVGLLALRLADMGLDQLPAAEQLHHRGGGPGIEGLADVLPRHRVQALADLDVDVRADLAPRPLRQHERAGGSGAS